MSDKPRRGSVAICGSGMLGLITEDQPQEITYGDGSKGVAYVGVHLRDVGKVTGILGKPWSSRDPKVIGHISDLEWDFKLMELFTDKEEENRLLALTAGG